MHALLASSGISGGIGSAGTAVLPALQHVVGISMVQAHCSRAIAPAAPAQARHMGSHAPAAHLGAIRSAAGVTASAGVPPLKLYTTPITRGFAAQSVDVPSGRTEPSSKSLDDLPPPPAPAAKGSGKQLFSQGYVAPHPGIAPAPAVTAGAEEGEDRESFMEHPVYDLKYLESIKPCHRPPVDAADRVGLAAVRVARRMFDLATGYGPNMTEAKWLHRIIFLETVAGVPGMVAGMLRHLTSLRRFQRDRGWIHTLLEEAENERMHLMTFYELRQPGPFFRTAVIAAQGVFFNLYFLLYLLWPKACHAFVGYLEEEAVRTYTHALQDIDEGRVWQDKPAPAIACTYWRLPKGATMRDLILVVRADEACHSHVNATLKQLDPTDPNPFAHGKAQLP